MTLQYLPNLREVGGEKWRYRNRWTFVALFPDGALGSWADGVTFDALPVDMGCCHHRRLLLHLMPQGTDALT